MWTLVLVLYLAAGPVRYDVGQFTGTPDAARICDQARAEKVSAWRKAKPTRQRAEWSCVRRYGA